MSELSLSQGIISSETFNHVVKELGTDANDLIAAVQEDEAVFCVLNPSKMNPELSPRTTASYKLLSTFAIPTYCYSRCNGCEEYIKREVIEENEQTMQNEGSEYSEDQKNILWYQTQQYEYGEQQQAMFAHPVPTIPQIPANVDYAGSLDFDIVISSQTANRNSWIYSSLLRKVFINMQNILPIDVKRNASNLDLYIRATLLYSLPQYAQELVERCSTHVDLKMMQNRDVSPEVVKHVLRCTNPGSVYMGDVDKKQHLSVLTPLGQPQAGMDTVRVNYQFMCKNSCPSGMNRRAVDVIFTLEDNLGNVLGRRKLSVRVCSCPKRDKEKEEKEYRDSSSQPAIHARKRKHNSLAKLKTVENGNAVDDNIYEIPAVKVVGLQVAETMLKAGRDRLCYDIHSGIYDEAKEAKAREFLEYISSLIKNLHPEQQQ